MTEVHDINPDTINLPKKCKIITITSELKKNLTHLGIDGRKILVAPDGVDIENFDIHISKKKARDYLNINANNVILYSGYLSPWKGAHILAEAAKQLPDFFFIFVGGGPEQVENFKHDYNLDNIRIEGHKPPNKIPFYLKAADMLVLPNSASSAISRHYTSPLKLFEYMASKRPIVASDLPSLREVLNESMAVFFNPDDPSSLAKAIKQLSTSKKKMERLAQRAFFEVQKYSWRARTQKIIDFIKSD